jgi:hypothetical protein
MIRFARRFLPGSVGVWALAAVFLSLVGCSSRPPKDLSISGKVTLKGTPIPGGTIRFHGADEVTASGPIEADGTYKVASPPIGKVKVSLINPRAALGVPAAMDPNASPDPKTIGGGGDRPAVEIPIRYSQPDNGLTVEITTTPPQQTKDFDLEP